MKAVENYRLVTTARQLRARFKISASAVKGTGIPTVKFTITADTQAGIDEGVAFLKEHIRGMQGLFEERQEAKARKVLNCLSAYSKHDVYQIPEEVTRFKMAS